MPSGSPTLSGGSTRRLTGSGHTSTQTKYRYTIPFPQSPTSSLSSSLSSSPSNSLETPTGTFFPRDFGALLNKPPSALQPRKRDPASGPDDVTFKVFSCEKGRSHAIQFYEKKRAGGGMGMRGIEKGGLCLGFATYEVPEDVEFGILEKKVYFDEDSGEWVLQLVSEVSRGRRKRRTTH